MTSQIILELSDGNEILYDKNDVINLIIARKYVTPKITKGSYNNKQYISVSTYDLINIKFLNKKFYINDGNAEEKAKIYFKSLPSFNPLNIKKYVITISILKVYNRLKYFQTYFRYYKKPIEYDSVDVPIPSRVIGIWLGDGNSNDNGITNIDPSVIKTYTDYTESIGLKVIKKNMSYWAHSNKNHNINHLEKDKVMNIILDKLNNNHIKDISIKLNVSISTIYKYIKIYNEGGFEAIDTIFNNYKLNPFYQNLKNLKLINNKHIPDIYKKNSIKNRLELLAGFIDTDGSLNETGYDISQGIKNEKIFDDIKEIAESLGFTMSKYYCTKTCMNKGKKIKCPAVRGTLSGDIHLIPVEIEYKKMKSIKTQRYDLLKFNIKSI